MSDILNPSIYLSNFELREPITTLTDFLVAIVAFVGFLRLRKLEGLKTLSYPYFKFYFLCFAIGMTSAAWFGHGLQAYVGPEYKRIGWVFGATGLLIFGLGTFKLIQEYFKTSTLSIVKAIFIVQYLVFVFLMIHPHFSDFKFAQLNSTVSLIAFILPMHIFSYIKSKSDGSRIVVLNIFFALIPGLVFTNQISISKWLNYHDISHILMAIFMFFMILGTTKLSKSRTTTP